MPNRRRRPVRRPSFRPAPTPVDDEEAAPVFADEPAVTVPGYASPGPIDTRPQPAARKARLQGRRLEQLRRSSGEQRVAPRSSATGMLPTFAAGYISGEIRQILITTGAMVGLLVVLAFVLR